TVTRSSLAFSARGDFIDEPPRTRPANDNIPNAGRPTTANNARVPVSCRAVNRPRSRFDLVLAGLLVLGGVTRLLYRIPFRGDVFWSVPIPDSKRYLDWATAWAAGRAFEPGTFQQAPLYPALLSVLFRSFGPRPGIAYVVQCVLGLITLGLVGRIARRAYG